MSSNESLLRKADLTIADLQANGGYLQPEEAATFIRKLIKQPTLIRECRVVEMTSPKRLIDKIGFGKRILRKGQSGVALTEAQRSKPKTEQVELVTDEVIAEVRIPYQVMEDNIERAIAATNGSSNAGATGGLKNTIIDLIVERAALDLEELGLLGDKSYRNPDDSDDQAFLSLTDGWLKRGGTDGHVVNLKGETISKNVFKKGKFAMPVQYLRNVNSLRHYVSHNNQTEYQDTLADRGTSLGDSMVEGTRLPKAFGSDVAPVALMPEERGLFTNPLNLIMGIQRQVSLEFDKSITERVYIIVLTARIAYQVEEADALVVYEGIGEAA